MVDNFSALRTARGAPTLFDEISTAAQITPDAQYELTEGASDTQFQKGLRTGASGLTAGSFANQALSQEVAGNGEWSRSRDLALETLRSGQRFAPRVSSLRNITNLSDAGDYAASTTGQGLMSMAPTLGTALLTRGRGGATAFLGGAGAAYNLERGEAALGQYSDPTLAAASVGDRDLAATTKGVINAGLESFVPAGLATSLLRKPAGSYVGHVARDALTEGATETAQQAVGFGAEQYLDPSRQLDPMDMADAFASGVLTGGTASGVTRAPQAVAAALPKSAKENVGTVTEKMSAVAEESTTPDDFLKNVFTAAPEEDAADDARPDTEDPTILNAKDLIAAMEERDAKRAERTVGYAEELLKNGDVPQEVKDRIAEMGGDYSDPDNQNFIASTLANQRTAEKMSAAVDTLVSTAKEGRTVKNNLQDTTEAEQATFNKLIFDNLTDEAKADSSVREKLPELANAVLAFAAKTGDLTSKDLGTLSRVREGLSLFADPEALAAQLTEYAGLPRPEDSFLSRIKRLTNAQEDVAKPNSFLYSSLTDEAKEILRPSQLRQLARVVDDFTLSDNAGIGDKLIAGLTTAFGSADSVRAVLDYYQQQNRAELKTETEGLTEKDAPPSAEYQFSDPKTLRPYRVFAGQTTTEGGMRRRVREATMAGGEIRRAGGNAQPVKMSQYVSETGGDAEAEVKRIAADIKARIKQHEGRKNEDRSEQINILKGELELLRSSYKENGANAALDLYEVLKVENKEDSDVVASDQDIAKFSALADAQDARGTRVTFKREDGTKFTLSAESMWKTQGTKEGSGKGENAQSRAKRLFADAVASVLARPEVTEMVTPEDSVLIDRAMNLQAKKKPNPKYRAMVSLALNKASTNIKALGDRLEAVVEEYLEDGARKEGDRRDEIERVLDENIKQLTERLDLARQGEGPLAGNMPAQAVARHKLRMYRDTLGQIDAIKFDEAFDEADNDRSGVPGSDQSGPLGPNELPRTRMNEELSDPGTRYAEEDTGLGVGVEKRGSTPSAAEREADEKQSTMGAKPGKAKFSAADRQAILDEIRRIRGNKVKVFFTKFARIRSSGEYSISDDKVERIIKIAVNAANPMGVAWHESLHDFFAMLDETPDHRRIKKDLIDAAEAPHIKKKLRELLAGHPNALVQIEKDPEERVAYMYQFWAEGLLNLGPTGTSIFEKIKQFFRDVLGVVGAEARAADLLTALHKGEFADPSIVAQVVSDLSSDRLSNKAVKFSPELNSVISKLFSAAPDRLRNYRNDRLTELADMFSSETGKLGFIQKRFQQQGLWENKLAGILAGSTAAQRRAALDNLQAIKPPSSKLEQDLLNFFDEMHTYLSSAGVQTLDSKTKNWVPIRRVKNYFPRVFDRSAILADQVGFIKLLQQHSNMTVAQATATANALMHGTGQLDLVEDEHSLGFTPYAQAVQDRKLTFINASNAADFAKYQSKDLADITTGYVKQAVHRGEYARMFGNSGEKITELIAKSGVTDKKELTDIGKTVRGLEGSLGSEMSSTTKELMSAVMTLQNLVILPLSLFSQMIDPVVMAARSGELSDAGKAYMTAIKRLVGKKVDGEELANMLGIISQDSVLEAMGVAYGAAHMSQRMRDINRVFFKYNGLQGWNNSMRIAATAAGERYLIAHKNDPTALDELGLKPADIKVRPDGRLDVSGKEVQEAMFRFVDQAVLRPSASHRPVWMSDPRFILIAHLKQFTFAMHNVVLKRAARELANDNPKPWGILMLAMPVILAADMAKFALTGNVPDSWAFKDYLLHAVERSGLLGLGDITVQATKGIESGKMPGEGLLGPTFEHLMEILRWLSGDPRTDIGDVVDRTIPGARIL